MGRVTPIRLTDNDRAEYQRLVNNAKSKIRRTNKKYGIDLSGEIPLPKIEEFQTRKQLNEWKEQQERFVNPHNTKLQYKKNIHGVVASKHELFLIERDTKRAQRLVDAQAEKIGKVTLKDRGKPIGTVGDRNWQMGKGGKTGITRPEDFNFNKVTYPARIKELLADRGKKADIKTHEKIMERMKDNYVKAITKAFNSDADKLAEKINSMSPLDFYEFYQGEEDITFDLFYPPDGTSYDPKIQNHEGLDDLNRITQYLNVYEQEKSTNPLWGLFNKKK